MALCFIACPNCRISIRTKLFKPLSSNNGIIILYLDYSLIFIIQAVGQLYFFHFSYFPSDDQTTFLRHLGFKCSFAVTGQVYILKPIIVNIADGDTSAHIKALI